MNTSDKSDRELLELAAKAYGIDHWFGNPGTIEWDPLADDGDALRLAVRLKFKITVGNEIVMVEAMGRPDIGQLSDGDIHAATRLAIVRAAAAIGAAQ